MWFCNRNQCGLHRREPEREEPGRMFDIDAEETLERSHDRGMHHDDALFLSRLIDAEELEALGHVDIQLNGGDLPLTADGISGDEVDLGAVERGFTGRLDEVRFAVHGDFAKRRLSLLPHGGSPQIFFGSRGIVERETNAELSEADRSVERVDDLPDRKDLVFHVDLAAKNVRVVLGEAAHAREPMEFSGLLVAVTRRSFRIPLGKIAVAALLAGID